MSCWKDKSANVFYKILSFVHAKHSINFNYYTVFLNVFKVFAFQHNMLIKNFFLKIDEESVCLNASKISEVHHMFMFYWCLLYTNTVLSIEDLRMVK